MPVGDPSPDVDFMMQTRGSDVLMISFGGLHEGFNFVNLAERMDFDGLFFRDTKEDWYTSGVRGLSSQMDDVCAFINNVVAERPYRQVFCLGQSSGGYAALRYALEIEPSACLAFAPQTTPFVDVESDGLAPGVARSRPHPGIDALRKVFLDRQPSFLSQIHLCMTENDNPPENYFWDDWLHAYELRGLDNVEIVPHGCSYHPVAYYLTGLHLLDDIVKSLLARVGPRSATA